MAQRGWQMATKAAKYKIKRVYSTDGADAARKHWLIGTKARKGKCMHDNGVGAELSDAQFVDAGAPA
jgi:hypothetical protein